MDSTERTYSVSEIREQRRVTAQRLALQQRQLDALAKMDEAADELEQVEREMEALDRGETQPEHPAEAVSREPHAIGERSTKILEDHADIWLYPRDILAEMDKRGWMDTDPGHAIQRLRHSLRRLAQNNPQIERDETGTTYRYRYRSRIEGYALIPVEHPNGTARPALQGGRADA
jgi:hypothetical protein